VWGRVAAFTVWGNVGERHKWGDKDEVKKIIVRYIFRKYDGVVWTGLSWPWIGTGGGQL